MWGHPPWEVGGQVLFWDGAIFIVGTQSCHCTPVSGSPGVVAPGDSVNDAGRR